MPVAITRQISPRFAECEITHIDRSPINVDIARAQHREYTRLLASLGSQIIELPEETDLPDSAFVEDTAVVLPEVAVITRPGADSRKPETDSITRVLSPYRPLVHITEPGTIDGGDVLVLGKRIYIGLSTRTNADAIRQIQDLLDNYGYMVSAIELHDCLHLKTAVTRVDENTLLINKNWVEASHFKGFGLIEVDPTESFAANCLPIGNSIVYPTVFPKTQEKLEKTGCRVATVNVAELAKAEGAVTCCSLIIAD
ncbi:MAG: dimethylargininase [Chloroflexi bacterium]|nr:dimethylargininase [Chloroflexota bacterium]